MLPYFFAPAVFGVLWGLLRTEQSCERMNVAYCYLVMLLRSMKLQGKPMMKHFFDLKDYASIYSAPGVIGLFEYENDVNHVAGFTQPRETVTGSISLE